MTDRQLYLAIGAPMLLNAALIGLLPACTNGLNDEVRQQFRAMGKRVVDMRELWRAERRRVEGFLNARLKHLEER